MFLYWLISVSRFELFRGGQDVSLSSALYNGSRFFCIFIFSFSCLLRLMSRVRYFRRSKTHQFAQLGVFFKLGVFKVLPFRTTPSLPAQSLPGTQCAWLTFLVSIASWYFHDVAWITLWFHLFSSGWYRLGGTTDADCFARCSRETNSYVFFRCLRSCQIVKHEFDGM